MPWKRFFRPTNMRVRLGVGLFLAALFCIQCSQSEAVRSFTHVTAVAGENVGATPGSLAAGLEKLARTDHVALLKTALARCRDNYQDYTCTFIKQERIKGQLGQEQWIDVKFREQPFSVAMKWTKNPPMGEQVLYVAGRYNGMMLVLPKGVWRVLSGGPVLREPAGPEAMSATLRPVTMFGFRNTLENLLKVYEEAAQRGECVSKFVGYGEVEGRRALILQRDLPARNDYPAKVTLWYLDCELLIPLGMKATDWDDQLTCSYVYKDVKLNVGLTDKDFTPEANGMKMKK